MRNAPRFAAVADKLNEWFKLHLQGGKTGVLVSHNTAVDIQFLMCEYMREGKTLPVTIQFGVDILTTLRRFSSICYRKVQSGEWSTLTDKGKPFMGVKPCAIYALSKHNIPENFEAACGHHHNVDADTRVVAVILFDESQFKTNSLDHCIFKSNRKYFQPLKQAWDAMTVAVDKSVIEVEDIRDGWVAAEVSARACHTYLYTH